MRLVKVNNLNYKVSDKGNIYVDKNNLLHFDFDTATLIEVFDRFLEKIKPYIKQNFIIYQGDNVYLKDEYLNYDNEIIILLRDYTYMIKSDYLKEEDYQKIFKDRGNWKPAKEYDNVDYLFIQGPDNFFKNKKLWYINTIIVNKLERESIKVLKKNNLHNIIDKIFLNKQLEFTLRPKFNPQIAEDFIKKNKIIIMKPTDGYAGKGIQVIDNYQDFVERIKELKKLKKKDNWSDKKNVKNFFMNNLNWVLETYIIDPYLYEGKKTHFRTFYIYTSDGKGYIYNKHRLAIAEEEFKLSDFKNKKIHDTHFQIKDDNIKGSGLVFLDDILKEEDYENITDQLIIIFKSITRNIKMKIYPETKFGFEIFAADLILRENLTVKLLEVNTNPGFNRDHFQAIEIFKGIMNNIVDVILPPKNKKHYEDFLIPVYDEKIIRSPKGIVYNFIDQVAEVWHKEGYGPKAKKDKTGGYYLSCKGKKQEVDENHIHIVGSSGQYHKNSWSRKVKERRRWEFLDFNLTPKEQAYHIYVKSNFRQDKECLDYYKTHKRL